MCKCREICNVIHVPCNRLIVQYLVKQIARSIVYIFVTYGAATCFDLYKVIVREVYAKAVKDSKLSQRCVCVRVCCTEQELRYAGWFFSKRRTSCRY
jgi:hypothetical protein